MVQNLAALLASAPILSAPATSSTTSNIDAAGFLANAAGYIENIGNYIIIIAGIIMIIIGGIQLVKGLAGGGRGQTNWVMTIGCILVGGLLTFGGIGMLGELGKIGEGTINEINNGDSYGDKYRQQDTLTNGGLTP